MQNYEYKVVPAPNRGKKARGVKTPEARFANGIEGVLNEMAAEGWEYQRAEMLPSEERAGLTGTKTTWRNLLVFRRALAAATHSAPTLATTEPTPATAPSEAAAPEADAEPSEGTERVAAPSAQPAAAPAPLTAIAGDPEAPPEAIPVPGPGARRMVSDDGVEELSPVSGLTAALKARASRGKPDE